MKTKIRRLRTEEFFEIETQEGDCVHCEATRKFVARGRGIIFLETEAGEIRRVEEYASFLGEALGVRTFLCREVTEAEALAEIAGAQ